MIHPGKLTRTRAVETDRDTVVVAAGRSGLAVPVGARLGPVSAVPDVEPADAAALRGLRLGIIEG